MIWHLYIWRPQGFNWRPEYLGHWEMITSHEILWDVINYPCSDISFWQTNPQSTQTWVPFQHKDHPHRCGDFHYKEKMTIRLSYLHNGNLYAGLYWDGPQDLFCVHHILPWWIQYVPHRHSGYCQPVQPSGGRYLPTSWLPVRSIVLVNLFHSAC